MAAGVVVSREVPAPRGVVWTWLFGSGEGPGPTERSRVALGTTVLDLDLVDPVDGFSGTAPWGGVLHRVTGHLVERGHAATLLVLTADPDGLREEDLTGVLGGGRSALAHRHAHRDLEALADGVARQAATPSG